MTTSLPTILANFAASLRYNRAQARRERSRLEAERVCRETQERGAVAVAEQPTCDISGGKEKSS